MISRSAHPLLRLLSRRRLRICGVNTGTSIDGLDLALVAIEDTRPQPRVRLLWSDHRPFPRPLARRLRQLAAETRLSKEDAARADLALGNFIAGTVNSLARQIATGRHNRSAIDLVASHGLSIGHWAGAKSHRAEIRHATQQIGALNLIAQRTGVVTIGDFRVADVAAGGMGAPLSGYYHHLMFGDAYVVLNLGGIANISASRRRRGVLQIRAFDVGPGNMLIDALAQDLLKRPYDSGGRTARRGRVIESIVQRALADPYFQGRPPKSCGREEFGADFALRLFYRDGRPQASPADCLATAVEITARAVADAVARWFTRYTATRSLLISGGGARNTALTGRISELLPGWTLGTSEEIGIPVTHVEPVGFAVLAHETLRARYGNLGGATGGQPAILGLIALPGREQTVSA